MSTPITMLWKGGVWLAYTRGRAGGAGSGPGSPLEHATVDGKTTLCGVKEIGGHEPTIPFDLDGGWSCKRCVRAIAKAGGPYETRTPL